MKLKKIFLIFIALVVFSPALTSVSDYDYLMAKYRLTTEAKRITLAKKQAEKFETKLQSIPLKNYSIAATEVTQKLYESVTGENPSFPKGSYLPVVGVSWFDCVVFCNKLSEKQNLEPCYSYKGDTDFSTWKFLKEKTENWSEGKWKKFNKDFVCNFNATGYRLPTLEEWLYAAKGGENYKYAGSDNFDEVGWYEENSDGGPHPVAQKKPNRYGLYDMSGNVKEWVWDVRVLFCYSRLIPGGDYADSSSYCDLEWCGSGAAYKSYEYGGSSGFRLARTTSSQN